MSGVDLSMTDRERAFVAQSEIFVEIVCRELGAGNVTGINSVNDRCTFPLIPTVIERLDSMTAGEKDAIASDYFGEHGVAYFVVENETRKTGHPIFSISEQLKDRLGLLYPMQHPMEGHAEAVRRFGRSDGTLKLYDLPKSPEQGYREQGETSELFAAHNDGLGYAGAVRTAVFYLDAPPAWGGYTYFTNVVRLSLDLLQQDEAAFRSLFLPDAITAIRPRGKGAIKVTSPILFLNSSGEPSVFFRVPSGEYAVSFREDVIALDRAVQFLLTRTAPFGPGSTFAHFTARGHGCIVRNQRVVHGRTQFWDSASQRRVLARKWYMSGAEHMRYKHVPGMLLKSEYATLYPEFFGERVVSGEWNYDADTRGNKRLK